VSTLIISDLHLGARSGVGVLSRAQPRRALWQALCEVQRLVLLGDVLELRHGPHREALRAARPFFQELGRNFADREVVLVVGNHDHALIDPWLRRRAELEEPEPLRLQQDLGAGEASPMLERIAQWAAPARVTVAYPGLWVREDVYATHGHYLDAHLTVPTMERLGIGAMCRLMRRPERSLQQVDDYEAVMGPVFAWIDSVAQQEHTGDLLNGQGTVRAWRALRGGRREGGWQVQLRSRLLAAGFAVAVASLNRAGIGHFRADISGAELLRAGLEAMGEVTQRLDLRQAYVIFGHTHRGGPLPGDEQTQWRTPAGGHLINAGCWTYDSYFLTPTPGESPYWPGGCVLVAESGPPLFRHLLSGCDHSELAPGRIDEGVSAER
jgi:hypothetical protein